MKYILAHDLGTSGNKATLFSEEGSLVASVTQHYPVYYSNGNWAAGSQRLVERRGGKYPTVGYPCGSC